MALRLYEGMSLREISEYLFIDDPPESAELIMVFGDQRPERADRAAELFKAGYAPRILVIGGDKRNTGVAEAVALRERLVALGVPESAIIAETRSLGTRENVQHSVALVEELMGWNKLGAVIIISGPAHMRRVKQVLARQIPRAVKIICCPDTGEEITADNWWQSEEGRQRVLRELEKVRTYSNQGHF